MSTSEIRPLPHLCSRDAVLYDLRLCRSQLIVLLKLSSTRGHGAAIGVSSNHRIVEILWLFVSLSLLWLIDRTGLSTRVREITFFPQWPAQGSMLGIS